MPERFELHHNYPNPFNPMTHFQFAIANLKLVTLKIYDVFGREVATLINKEMAPGNYTQEWDASGVASGMYFYRLTAGTHSEIRKMLLMK